MTAVMQPAAWIGECPEHALSGWSYFRTVADFASSGLQVDRIIVDDPAASLREVDCITLFTAAPLARITGG